MGREVRKVAENWVHPEGKSLHEGYAAAKKEFEEIQKDKGLQEAVEYMHCPDQNDYMPDWTEEEATHYQMYENVSEGSPISPVCTSTEELARWLTDNDANASASMSATYEQWLRVCKGGYAPSLVITGGRMQSGVAGFES